MLSALQRQVATIIAGLDEAEGFALAGGAALIVRREIDRGTRDLDFFGPSGDAVDRLLPAVEHALGSVGYDTERVQVSSGFARLLIRDGDQHTELDLGADARLFPIEPGDPAPTLSSEELAVDKVLAVFGRAEARDFADLSALEPRYGLKHLFKLAAEKDRGFSPDMFADMLGRFSRLRRDEFDLADEAYVALSQAIADWQVQALKDRPSD